MTDFISFQLSGHTKVVFSTSEKIPLLASKVNEYGKACLVLLCGWETWCHMTHTSGFASLALQCGWAVFWKNVFLDWKRMPFFLNSYPALCWTRPELSSQDVLQPLRPSSLAFGSQRAFFPPKSTAHPLRHAQVWRPTPKRRMEKGK